MLVDEHEQWQYYDEASTKWIPEEPGSDGAFESCAYHLYSKAREAQPGDSAAERADKVKVGESSDPRSADEELQSGGSAEDTPNEAESPAINEGD